MGQAALRGGMMTRTPLWRHPRIAPPRASTIKLTKNLENVPDKKKKKGGIVKNHRSTRILRCVMSVAGKKNSKKKFRSRRKINRHLHTQRTQRNIESR
jgi:hypothetical protein